MLSSLVVRHYEIFCNLITSALSARSIWEERVSRNFWGKKPETRLIFFLRFSEITSLPDSPQWDWAVPLKHPRSVQMPTPGQYQNFIFLQIGCKCHIYGNLWKSESKHWL